MVQTSAEIILLIISILISILILAASALNLKYSHFSNPKSDIVLDGELSSSSNAEDDIGEYSFSLYFTATNRGDLDGHIVSAEVEQIRFFNTEGPDEKVLLPEDLIGPYGNEPIVVLNEEIEDEEGNIEYEKGPILIPEKSTKEILIVPRIMGGTNPKYDDSDYNAVEIDLAVTISDTEREYEIKTNSGTVYARGVFDED